MTNDYNPKAVIERLRYERDKFRAVATQRRKDAKECKDRKDFLGALKAKCRENEYRDLAARAQSDIQRVKNGEFVA